MSWYMDDNCISKNGHWMKRKRLEEVVLNLLLILRYSFLKELLVESINADNFFMQK